MKKFLKKLLTEICTEKNHYWQKDLVTYSLPLKKCTYYISNEKCISNRKMTSFSLNQSVLRENCSIYCQIVVECYRDCKVSVIFLSSTLICLKRQLDLLKKFFSCFLLIFKT